MNIYAQILAGVVVNTIVADIAFAAFIAPQWQYVIRIDELSPRPGVGWLYDGQAFSLPAIEAPPTIADTVGNGKQKGKKWI